MDVKEFYTEYLSKFPLIKFVFGVGLTIVVLKISHYLLRRRSLHQVLLKKQASLTEVRVRVLECLPNVPELSKLCDLSTLELGRKLRAGEVKPTDILHAFQRRTADLLSRNCVAEVMIEASDEAEKLNIIKPTDSPLFGIPISIKEHIPIQGYDCPCGHVKNVNSKATYDAVLVKVLKMSGAIPFVSTSMPPSGMSQDSSNAIYGEQTNHLDSSRLAGGSSGGEALLLSGGGSPLGFGSDIGGSLRIPAAFCGISSLKPTFKRISQIGLVSDYKKSSVHIDVCLGPMSKYVDSIVDAMRCLLVPEMFALDASLPPLPFNENVFTGVQKKSLVIGYYTTLGGKLIPSPVPAVTRAVLNTKVLLEKAGHRLVEFTPPNVDQASVLFFRSLLSDGGKKLANELSFEPIPKSLQLVYFSNYIPPVLKRFAGNVMCAIGNETLGNLIKASAGCASSIEVFYLLAAISEYQREFAEAMRVAGVDAIICPVCAFPAPRKNALSLVIDAAVVYTGLYNLLDYPAGVVPVSKVSHLDIDAANKMEEKATDMIGRALASMQRGSEGLPLTVQVVAPPFREETVLRVMKVIEKECKFWSK